MDKPLINFLRLEKEKGLYKFKIGPIVLWNIFRVGYRYRFVSDVTGVEQRTNMRVGKRKWSQTLKYNIYSLCRLTKFILARKSIENVIIPFGRLQKQDGVFFDKFTDPVISASELKNRCIIFQPPILEDYHNRIRHEELFFPLDILHTVSRLFYPFYFLKHWLSGNYKVINELSYAASQIVTMSEKEKYLLHRRYLNLVIMADICSLLFKYFRVKRLFGVARAGFKYETAAAHKCGIPVYEFQHGVTLGETEYYSGPRCDYIDPDYFLAFGSLWNGTQFGISPEKIINIGWAYKDEAKPTTQKVIPNSVLFISTPAITMEILKTASELSIANPGYEFYIRCHPLEKYSDEQLAIVDKYKNLHMADNSVDSRIALGEYEYVIGENSSVVYEALSMGKKVARICYNGIESTRLSETGNDGFYYLFAASDFLKFVCNNSNTASMEAYSDFKRDFLSSLPE